MSASLGNQISGLRVLAQRLNPKNLAKATGMRESEAQHLIDMVKDASATLEHIDRYGGDAA